MQCRECDAVLPAEARFCLSCGARIEPEAPDSTIDPLFETLKKAIGFQYRIERLLGRGGMGAVYLAHEFALDRDVAIKVLPPEQASTPQMRERFRREARTAARLSHPHIVPLHTFGEVSGLMYFVMGYVAGESLAARLKREGPFHPEEARSLLVAICDALDYAHRHGIVHRDIKPDNMIDTALGAPLLTDFGIAKPALAEAQLTTTGQLIGTPQYMSPEQALGRSEVDGRSDLYSLGVVAYEMILGRRPFDAENPMHAITQRLTRDARPLGSAAPDVPPDLALAVDRCLQGDVTKRWPDAKSLREALQPLDEESEDSVPGQLLRTSVTIATLAVLAFRYLSIYSALNHNFRLLLRVSIGIVITLVTMVIMAVASAMGLRSYGLDGRSIIRKAFQQPRWWRSWYPRALRRPGDVWSRLPPELRRFRLFSGALQIYAFVIVIPLHLMLALARWPIGLLGPGVFPAVVLVLLATLFGLGGLLLAERRRATKFVRAKVNATPAEVNAILTAPTWGVATWRRVPISSLLDGRTRRVARAKRPARARLQPRNVRHNCDPLRKRRPIRPTYGRSAHSRV